jgi:hypothetical protein
MAVAWIMYGFDGRITTIGNFFVVEEFYTIKFADLIGAIPYCSMYEAVDRCLFRRASSTGVFPSSFLAFGSAPASMRALMITSGAPW